MGSGLLPKFVLFIYLFRQILGVEKDLNLVLQTFLNLPKLFEMECQGLSLKFHNSSSSAEGRKAVRLERTSRHCRKSRLVSSYPFFQDD